MFVFLYERLMNMSTCTDNLTQYIIEFHEE